MGLFGKIFGGGKGYEPDVPEPEINVVKAGGKAGYTKEQLDEVVDYVRGQHSESCYPIKTTEAAELEITDSKFGGYPYWDMTKEYPKNSKGEPLLLLAQINFAQADLNDDLLPEEGILQFFIDTDDCYGLNFKDNTLQDTFRVVYHDKIDEGVTEEDVAALGAKVTMNLDADSEYAPLNKQYALEFDWTMDSINVSCEDYDDAVNDALEAVLGVVTDEKMWNHLSDKEYDYLADRLNGSGHKIFGYPFFTQADPRQDPSGDEFKLLLLQIDSEGQDLMWGDSGVCNFFISEENLRTLDFSKVIYNWDCY